MSVVRAALSGALSLVFPTWCAGCDLPDVPLCAACRTALGARAVRRVLDGGLVVHAGTVFEQVPARVLRAFKEDGRTPLAGALAPLLAAAAAHVRREAGTDAVIVVPIPTSPAAFRRRGYRVAELVARRAGLRPQRLLTTRGAADQRGLDRTARAANMRETMRAAPMAQTSVLLVDDVVTTGATLREAQRAVTAAGGRVIGAAAVAATPWRHGRDVDTTSEPTARGLGGK